MRKDNELLILANKGIPEPKKPYPCLDTTLQRKSQETPQKPLKGHFTDYCTEDIDVTSPCERLPDPYQRNLDRNIPADWWETENNDKDFIQKWDGKKHREIF